MGDHDDFKCGDYFAKKKAISERCKIISEGKSENAT